MNKNNLYIEKYRPKSLGEYLFHDGSHQQAFQQMVDQQSIPNLLFSGPPGTGKSSICQILVNELNVDPADLLFLNASRENSVDVMRDKISSFIDTLPLGSIKVVVLDESDTLTFSAQAALRNMMESNVDNVRFMLTCNYDNKILPALKSRCQHFVFRAHDRDDILEHVAKILVKENIKFTLDLLEKYVAAGYPDIRKILVLLQQNIINSVLMNNQTQNESDYKFKILDLLDKDDWYGIRMLLCDHVPNNEWENVYQFLYQNVGKSTKFSDRNKLENAILVIAEYLYKHAFCADPNINAAAMFIRLGQL